MSHWYFECVSHSAIARNNLFWKFNLMSFFYATKRPTLSIALNHQGKKCCKVILEKYFHKNLKSITIKMPPKVCIFATSGLCCKCFMIVIYDHNDSGQCYKTTIVVKSSPNWP